MESQFSRITASDIFQAVEKIENENIPLHHSTGYDVVINGKPYPPKEIIRISYKIATGEEIGLIYGGDQVNSPLRELGFQITQKISLWKLGCNWGRSAPSFYEDIKSRKIVIGVLEFQYNVGDLVLITEGFSVYAIARVAKVGKSITSNKKYESFCNEFDIDYEEWVLYFDADWYVLKETEIFTYQLQQGIRKIRNREIIQKTIDIWENRDTKTADFKFYLSTRHNIKSELLVFPCFALIQDSWNDYGYRTSFTLQFFKSYSERVEIGSVKILEENKIVTQLDAEFDSLQEKFCSLGQTLEYYKRLKEEFPRDYKKILEILNDCAFYDEFRKKFEKIDGFQISLLRSTEASLALETAKNVLEPNEILESFEFNFKFKIPEALDYHIIDFKFNTVHDLPNRFFCLIGKNGTGKTRILTQLANKLTDIQQQGEFIPTRPNFSKIISASFSYFDNFKLPERKDMSYEFIGLRNRKGLIGEKEMSNILWTSYKNITTQREKKKLWLQSIKNALEVEYFDFNIDELDFFYNKQDFVDRIEEIFSSGQKIIFQFITRLIETIEVFSLVIFDEPETHLHPNIAGRLLRVTKTIMDSYKSVCILSTHSPVIVQEVPSKFIRIVDRKDNMPIISKPSIECFGENLSIISNSIFHVDDEKELYKITLEELAEHHSIAQIEEIFSGKLSLNAKLYLQTFLNRRR